MDYEEFRDCIGVLRYFYNRMNWSSRNEVEDVLFYIETKLNGNNQLVRLWYDFGECMFPFEFTANGEDFCIDNAEHLYHLCSNC